MRPEDRIRRAVDRFARSVVDERQERTVATLKLAMIYALIYAVAVALVVVLLGCGAKSPTGPGTELEEAFLETAQCYASHLELGVITFATFEEAKPYCPRHGDCGYVACDAWPDSRHIECWDKWVNDPESVKLFHAYAAHEVCHLSGIWNETAAELCAFEMTSQGVCS